MQHSIEEHTPRQEFTAILDDTDLETFAMYVSAKSPEYWRRYTSGGEHRIHSVFIRPPLRPVYISRTSAGMAIAPPPVTIKSTRVTFHESTVEELEDGDFEWKCDTSYAHFDIIALRTNQIRVNAELYPQTSFARSQCDKLTASLKIDYPEFEQVIGAEQRLHSISETVGIDDILKSRLNNEDYLLLTQSIGLAESLKSEIIDYGNRASLVLTEEDLLKLKGGAMARRLSNRVQQEVLTIGYIFICESNGYVYTSFHAWHGDANFARMLPMMFGFVNETGAKIHLFEPEQARIDYQAFVDRQNNIAVEQQLPIDPNDQRLIDATTSFKYRQIIAMTNQGKLLRQIADATGYSRGQINSDKYRIKQIPELAALMIKPSRSSTRSSK